MYKNICLVGAINVEYESNHFHHSKNQNSQISAFHAQSEVKFTCEVKCEVAQECAILDKLG